jgi:FtsH-binding integral membrane protein
MSLIIQSEENIFKTKFSTLGALITVLLGCSILALAERVIYDLSRFMAPPPLDYFNNLSVIVLQAVFVVLFIIIALVVNLAVSNKKEKYAIALVPYFVVSIYLAIQVAFQVSVYFYNHHTTFEFYVVMLVLVVVSTYGIYHIQSNYKLDKLN